jgi:fibronectin type 3 domain-containing protein
MRSCLVLTSPLCQAKVQYRTLTRLAMLTVVIVACGLHAALLLAAPIITYVQNNNATPQTSQTTVNVTFTAAQAVGDLNVVVVGWNDSTAVVNTVTDKSGNVYTRAVGPTAVTGQVSQSIYYAKNIVAAAAGANIVTVTFSIGAQNPDIRILEYRGADLNNPIDVIAANTGSSTTSSSGNTTTTNPTDLLFAANMVATFTTTPGTGFTSRIITSPDGDMAEERMVTATGTYSATATLSSAGPWVMQMVAFRTTGSGDTTSPTAPTNLTATVSGSQINLSWTASTDNVGVTGYRVERCQGAGCMTFAQIGTPATTTYSDTGLGAGNYSYRVRATDAAGNLSGYSNLANGVILDTQPPTAPSNLTATVSGSQINVSWTASTDNVGVSGYMVERCQGAGCTTFAQIATPTANSYSDTGLAIGSYSYRVRATDAVGNLSGYSNTASGTITDTQPPTAPSGLTATVVGSQINLSWTASTDNVGVTGYRVERCQGAGCTNFAQIAAPATTTYSDTGLGAGTYSYRVRATDAAGNLSPYSNVANGAIPDTQPPTAPSGLTATAASVSQINLSWTASTDNVGVTGYMLERCQGTGCTTFAQIAAPASAAYLDTGLTANTSYSYRVKATDAAGNFSNYSNQTTATTPTISLTVTPRVSALTFMRTQQFTVNNGNVIWSVDGALGGSASSGTISTTGLYTPPNSTGSHTVTATTSDQSQSGSATVYVTNYSGTFTFHNDNLRTGQNSNETVLTSANVNAAQFGKLFSYPVDGFAYASPLYAANVTIPGKGFHNVVYVATEHDSVYAFDADGLSSSPLWQVSFLNSGVTTVPCADTGECGDIPNEIGITSTPVIDPASGTIYLLAKTKEGTNYVQRLHALDIATGAEKFGGPVVIQASVPGTGDGTSTVTFNALRENQRPGLLLSNGVLYLGFGSHGDIPTWYGWILAYDSTTLQQVMAYNSTPDATEGGIWQSGGGLATDNTGNIYFATGNGVFDANTGGRDYGDTVVKLSTLGTVVDYFTPHDQANLAAQDFDLSSAGPTLLVDQPGPNPHVLITSGKGGTIYIINRDNMGHYNSGSDNQIIQTLVGALPHGTITEGNFSAPVFFNSYVYFGAVDDHLKAFQLSNGLLSTTPTSQSVVIYPNRGGAFAVSANGASNGILWAMQDNSFNTPNNGVLRAYDAGSLSNELYNTGQAGSRDALDIANKFSIPLVANGKVFIVSQTQLVAYGLLP